MTFGVCIESRQPEKMNKAAELLKILETKQEKPSKIDLENLGISLKDFDLVAAKRLMQEDRILAIDPRTGKWAVLYITKISPLFDVFSGAVSQITLPSGEVITEPYKGPIRNNARSTQLTLTNPRSNDNRRIKIVGG